MQSSNPTSGWIKLSIYPREIKPLPRKDHFIPIYIATLFTIDKTWKKPKTSTDEWLKKLWYVYNRRVFNHEGKKRRHFQHESTLRALCKGK